MPGGVTVGVVSEGGEIRAGVDYRCNGTLTVGFIGAVALLNISPTMPTKLSLSSTCLHIFSTIAYWI